MAKYDVIVIGGGGMGSSVASHVAKQGSSVLVLDQFARGHQFGSSHGATRMIRKAYFEHPDYVPLLQRAYKLWQLLEETTGRTLLSQTGLFLCGPQDSPTIRGARQAADLYALELETVEDDEYADRFPGFRIPADADVIYEVDGGMLHVEACVDAYLSLAEKRGAELRWETPVTHWEANDETVKVWTANETIEARSLVITSGSWASDLLSDVPGFPQLQVLRKVMFWFPVTSDAYDFSMGGSGFFFEMPDGEYYGFPSLDGEHIKICEHSGGDVVDHPSELDREVHPADLDRLAGFIENVLPDVDPRPTAASVCLYTMSPDGHFVVDRHPQHENVVFGAGFSGHGFKFASVIGKALADLALERQTELPIEFLGLRRFQ